MNGFEVGEIIIHAIDGRHGRLIGFAATRAPMAQVRWKDLSVTTLPINMIRKKDNLSIPTTDSTPLRYKPRRHRAVPSPKKKQLASTELEIDQLLKAEKALTADWYMKMSMQVPWGSSTREWFQSQFDKISQRIAQIQSNDTAEWFAGLPQENSAHGQPAPK